MREGKSNVFMSLLVEIEEGQGKAKSEERKAKGNPHRFISNLW